MFEGGLEKNSRKQRDLLGKLASVHSLKMVLLILSQGKKKKGGEVADDEDDDAVRTSVSQDRVTAALCTKEWFLSNHYI
jgi:hypothetical protein